MWILKAYFWPKMIQDYHQVYKKFPFPLSLLNKNIERTFLCLPKNFVKLTWPDGYGFRHSFFVLGQESLAEIHSRPVFFRQFDEIFQTVSRNFFLFSKLMRMSLQSKSLVGKEISSLKPRLRLGFRGRNFFADLGLGLQRYISFVFHGLKLTLKSLEFTPHCSRIS